MIFQDPTGALNARQTIYEAVAEGLRIQERRPATRRQLVAEALSRAGLRPPERFFARYPLRDLRRPAPARDHRRARWCSSPSLLVADEPVSSLDASVRGEILALMLRLVRETEVAILVVTHDLGLAWNVADRVAVMYLGRIVEQGTTEEVLTAPRHPYTRALLSVVPEVAHVEPQILSRRGARPDADPGRLPLPPALPARGLGRGGAAGHRGALPRRGPRARAGARRARPARGVPRGGRRRGAAP